MTQPKKLNLSALLPMLALGLPVIMAGLAMHASQTYAEQNPAQTPKPAIVQQAERPKIQLAILLDTSSSMNGLINQSREQIWQVVNQFSDASQNGVKPILEVAVYEYGNDRLHSRTGFIRQISPLTSELDQVSEGLFALTTNGGQEYCGYVIQTAVQQLNWSDSQNDIKAIFIAGNEPFTQGPVQYQTAIAMAKQKGIVVNTIHAGDQHAGVNSGWKDGAVLAGGSFMSIDHNQQVAHVNAPQDKRIAELNAKLNETYIAYGHDGREKEQRQQAQDANSSAISAGLLAKRARAKASTYYRNESWDLVDADKSGRVKIEELKEEELPKALRDLSVDERKDYVQQKAAQRKSIQSEILALSKQRDAFVAKQKAKQAGKHADTMDEALSQSIQQQAAQKNFKIN